MPTARDTVHGMHMASGLLAFAAVQALQDGIERGQQLRAVARAHKIGRQRYVRAIKHKKAEMRAVAVEAAARFNANRKRLHG